MKRRQFVKSTANASFAISALPLLSATFKKNKTYRLGLIGSGWWGMNILREAIYSKVVKVVGICDVDERALKKVGTEVETLSADQPKQYKDFRELIDKEELDIVIVATPDHWHALNAIYAIQNGCHVFLEKPIGHTINEGRAILKAARDRQVVVQVDTHRRASAHNISAMDFLKSGKVGKISSVKCFVNNNQGAGSKTPNEKPPAGLDWDMWCGPAPYTPFNPRIHPKGFRNFLDYANGTLGDWGIHWFDQVLWWTEERYPKTVFSSGGRYVKEDNTDAPDTQYALYEFESFNLHWEHKLTAKNVNEEHNIGCYFYGTEGTLHLGWRDGWTFYPSKKSQSKIKVDAQLNAPNLQNIKELWADFIQAIEMGRRPICDIEDGHLASNVSLLGMLSYKLGRSIEWDGKNEEILNDPEANKLLHRDYRGEWEYPE
ncbi:MAG: Gfo/Idh/MocA family oxidoreductase [Bacteroidota bacterium]